MTAPAHTYDPVSAVLDALREAGCQVKPTGRDTYSAQCPAHDDRDPSLSVSRGTKGEPKAIVYCHAGCSVVDILDSLDLDHAALFADYDPDRHRNVTYLPHVRAWKDTPDPKPEKEPRPWTRRKAEHYDYVWPDGSPCARVVKFHKVDNETGEVVGKTFAQQRYNPDTESYITGLDGLDVPLYHADTVAAAVQAGLPIFVCEGEKDADRVIEAWKLPATCNPMGADSWRPHHTQALAGANVVIIADDDKAGRAHAEAVAEELRDVAKSVTLRLPVDGCNDASDHINDGNGISELRTWPETETIERTTWYPADIGPVIANDDDGQPDPCFLQREDGHHLFYPGRVNGLIGESESGKTWIGLLCVRQALACGKRVLYLDFEDSAGGIVGRLKALGTSLLWFPNFYYMAPDENLSADAARDLRDTLATYQPDLIILDGFNAAMTILGLDLGNNTDATKFAQVLLKPLAATGAAVAYIDHVPKNKDSRGKGGIGAQAKRAMTTGCAILVEIAEPFGKGKSGKLNLHVDKDRPGKVRAVSQRSEFIGAAIIESVEDHVEIIIKRPPDDGGSTFKPTRIMSEICQLLADAGTPLNATKIKAQIPGRDGVIVKALSHLLAEGCVVLEDGPRNSDNYRLIHPFNPDEQE